MPYINTEKFQEIFGQLTKKEKNTVDEFLKMYGYGQDLISALL
jgi:hypothetical protein